ncbi:hypothetical protein [Furfurilactobacillus entadae]|uniref:hypothetical protein n=1 Tax=Furfurilactobacillus entadae TaxID=2922307 RepID=UPI0035E90614
MLYTQRPKRETERQQREHRRLQKMIAGSWSELPDRPQKWPRLLDRLLPWLVSVLASGLLIRILFF